MATPLRKIAHDGAHPLGIRRKPARILRVTVEDVSKPDPLILQRVRAEFDEMLGYGITLEQMVRLFDLPIEECRCVLNELLNEGFLCRRPDGRYRVTSC